MQVCVCVCVCVCVGGWTCVNVCVCVCVWAKDGNMSSCLHMYLSCWYLTVSVSCVLFHWLLAEYTHCITISLYVHLFVSRCPFKSSGLERMTDVYVLKLRFFNNNCPGKCNPSSVMVFSSSCCSCLCVMELSEVQWEAVLSWLYSFLNVLGTSANIGCVPFTVKFRSVSLV